MSNFHLVIMAGGVGSRFWPMSRPEKPKQFIDVLGVGRTLIQLTADRFGADFEPSHTWVVTSGKYADMVHEQLPDVPRENILLEPCMRNTAPCISYVVWKIRKRFPDAVLVVSPADHFVVDIQEFRNIITRGLNFVGGTSRVLTLGMKPTYPNTGYGYIHSGKKVDDFTNEVQAFKEKPQLEVAKQYLAEGGYYWNGGIFLWDAATAEAAIRAFEPEMAALFDQMAADFYTEKEQTTVDEVFPQCKNISIDYAVMERLGGKHTELNGKEAGVYVMPSDFGWSDLGTWGSLHTQLDKDTQNNAVVGKDSVSLIESQNCVVRASGKLQMVLQGLDGYIVAEDDGVLLICKKDQEQRIKEFSSTINK
ncbi:MAG: mannose-1-phosphate guanylyltransferase [Bacteroidales bacterium]|nr:mannose-1-phosphate guanylyltransferase [Bacteroidales bacterium]